MVAKAFKITADLEEREPPRLRRVPERYEEGARSTYYKDPCNEDICKREYFEAYDNSITAIAERFKQEDVGVYEKLAGLLRAAVRGEDSSVDQSLAELYSDDFNADLLSAQLSLVHYHVSELRIETVKEFADWFISSPSRPYLTEVNKLLKLILTLPATNATSERTFSALKRIKTVRED